MKLTSYFDLNEVTFSDVAIRQGIDNTLPAIYLQNAILIAEAILEPIRANFKRPFSPSSWYRCPELNQFIGGSKNSQHMKAEAVDIRINGIPTIEIADYIHNNLEFDQLILEYHNEDIPHSGWVHCSYKKEGNRKQWIRIR